MGIDPDRGCMLYIASLVVMALVAVDLLELPQRRQVRRRLS